MLPKIILVVRYVGKRRDKSDEWGKNDTCPVGLVGARRLSFRSQTCGSNPVFPLTHNSTLGTRHSFEIMRDPCGLAKLRR